ncbi:MAG: hypothetical protein HYY79_06370, partial [Betaproteobacteria bacterium]|nr:hypothetical protein [Betaproteobacteria bacterium]
MGGIFNALVGLYLLIEGVPFLDPGTVRILAVAFLVFALVDFVIPRVIRRGWEARSGQQAGEKLIERFFTHPTRATRLGVGDDAALLRVARGKELAVSTDMLVAGTHFLPGADPYRLGHKALAVNLSDMAAMGATPRWATLSLALPEADARWLAKFARGFMDLARRSRVDLIGGDTTRGPLAICVQIMGEVAAGCALRRDGARAGDDVWVSGALG